MNDPRHALLLDELMRHPDYAQIAAWLNAQAPAHQRDQQLAAHNDAYRLMEVFSAIVGGTVNAHTSDQVPEWIRLSALHAWVQIADGSADTCMHNPNFDRPEPVVSAAWRPGMATCVRCTHLLQPKPGSVEDRTCDQCGHVCDTGVGELMHPCVIQVGPLVFQFGLCQYCKADTPLLQAA